MVEMAEDRMRLDGIAIVVWRIDQEGIKYRETMIDLIGRIYWNYLYVSWSRSTKPTVLRNFETSEWKQRERMRWKGQTKQSQSDSYGKVRRKWFEEETVQFDKWERTVRKKKRKRRNGVATYRSLLHLWMNPQVGRETQRKERGQDCFTVCHRGESDRQSEYAHSAL